MAVKSTVDQLQMFDNEGAWQPLAYVMVSIMASSNFIFITI